MMKANKQIGFININEESIDKILKDGEVVFERGFLREKTSTTLPITFGGVGKNLKDYRVYGNTYQNSTSGKNLLNPKLKSNGDRGITGEYNNETFEITITGTPTAIFANIGSNVNFETPLSIGTYTLSIPEIKEFRIGIHLYKSGGDIGNYAIASNKKELQITVSDEITGYYLYIYGLDTSKQYNDKFKVMFESGSTATDFEPYTGGQPCPNPDYPQEIVSCGDRTKNLCGELEQGSYNDTNGTKSTSTTNYRNKEPIKVLPNTNYIFSINGVGQAVNVFEYKADGTYIGRIGSGAVSSNSYFTTSSETGYINIFRGASAGIEKWQIEQNDTISSYEPYGYKIPINVRSDNLFDKTKVTNGYYIDNNGDLISHNSFAYSDYIQVIENAVYSYSGSSGLASYARKCAWYDNSKNLIKVDSFGKSGQLTSPNNAKYFRTSVRIVASGTQEIDIDTYQLVEGSTAPDKYIPYYNETTNIYLDEPLRGIGEYSDYIDFKNGKVVRNIEEIVLDGNENWLINGSGTNRWFYYVNNLTKNTPSDNGKYIISSHYIGNAVYSSNTNKGIVATKNSKELRIRYGVEDTIANFKTWLQSNNVTVDYVLATPTEESITLPNIPTIDGNNTLNIETEITPLQVYIKYKSNQ